MYIPIISFTTIEPAPSLYFFNPLSSLQPRIKPLHRLKESLLLCKLCHRLARIATDCKAVFDATVEVDLVGLASFLEDGFGGMALLGGEYGVDFCSL